MTTTHVVMEMEAPAGATCSLEIWGLKSGPGISSPIWDEGERQTEDQGLESIQLIEDGEYRYKVRTSELGEIRLEPPELFSADPDSSGSGRLRTGSHVGLLPIEAYQSGRCIGRGYVEVRSRKLDYASHYRWMLNDLVDFASSIVQERFAPIQQRVRPSETLDAANRAAGPGRCAAKTRLDQNLGRPISYVGRAFAVAFPDTFNHRIAVLWLAASIRWVLLV